MDLTRFLACWPYVLAQECPFPRDWTNPRNFSNDAHDPGGATMDGIIQSEYNMYCRQHGLPQQSVRGITQSQGQDIYVNEFWLPNCVLLPAGLDLAYFDSDVNEGGKEATRILQVALGLHNDGIWGPATNAAVHTISNLTNVIEAFTARRKEVYRETSGFQYFGTDWIRRATEIGNESLAMAAGNPPALMLKPPIEKHVPRARWYIEGRVV